MRIVVENSGYELLNVGDAAMLRVALTRLQALWPEAVFYIFTTAPERLSKFWPAAIPLSPHGRYLYHGQGSLFGPLARVLSRPEASLRSAAPQVAYSLTRIKKRALRRATDELDEYYRALSSCDLVVASGGGYLTDTFPWMIQGVYETTSLAYRLRKPVALLGHGLGPVEDYRHRRQLREILREPVLVTLRDGVFSPSLIRELEARCQNVVVTGDDAVALAYSLCTTKPGQYLGVGVRLSDYSEAASSDVRQLTRIFQTLGQELGCSFAPLPISQYCDGEDAKAIEAILQRAKLTAVSAPVATPEDVIALAGRCRVVFTGSYHAAVFALSQGVPVVAVHRATYYAQKFEGLAKLFGKGCKVLSFDTPEFCSVAVQAALELWAQAVELRDDLLACAADQIRCAESAYASLRERL